MQRSIRSWPLFFLIRLALCFVLVQAFAPVSTAQVRLNPGSLESKSLERRIPYTVLLPDGYDSPENKKKRYPVIYLLHGLSGHHGDWASKSSLAKHGSKYGFLIAMPEGNNGWWSDSATNKRDKYESYIIYDLIPEIDRLYRTISDRDSRVIAGLSMGGYGALKFGFKYPERFILAGSFSGALKAAEWDTNIFNGTWKVLSDSISEAYGSMGSNTRKENDLFRIVSSSKPDSIKDLPFFYVDCGTEDGLVIDNREFAEKLLEQKIPHEFRQRPGGHDWKYWDRQIREFLELSEEFTSKI